MKCKLISLLLAVALLLSFASCLAEAPIDAPIDTPISANTGDSASPWTNILFLGGDARSTGERYDRTDSMMIVSVNTETHEIKLTSVMRDTWVSFPGAGKSGKINAANVYGGPGLAMNTVNQAFDANIEKYVLINMNDMVELVDLAGGVDIEISKSELKWINEYNEDYLENIAQYNGTTWLNQSGMVHLNGLMATSYTRNRYTDSDFGRVERQQKVILALIRNLQNMEVDEIASKADAILSHIQTNLTEDEMRNLAQSAMICEIEEIGRFRIPADGTYQTGEFDGEWKIKADLAANAALLNSFIYGEAE